LSGATTIISPISDITAIKVRRPGAETPSSLVIKIKGLTLLIIVFFSRINVVKDEINYAAKHICNKENKIY
jgi:hypothetical protein